jgi:hypothetical protein
LARNFRTQLAGQIGESLVVAELGRRGIVATAFSGNVPDIDILAYANNKTVHLQVKTWRTGSVHFNGKRFIHIDFDGDRQIVRGLDNALDGKLIYVFVRLGESAGHDKYFILPQSKLQEIISKRYCDWLEKHSGVRPRNPKTTHCALEMSSLAQFENDWGLIEQRFWDELT